MKQGIFDISTLVNSLHKYQFFYRNSACIIALNIYLSPLIAFTVYFCFLHSIRHSASLIKELEAHIARKRIQKAVWKEHEKFINIVPKWN